MYVGITKNLTSRWKRHAWDAKSKNLAKKHAIQHAIAKYGINNFIFKMIEILPDLETANAREKEWIKSLKENNYQLYNETEGGDGTPGRTWNEEQKQQASMRNSGADNPMYGVQLFGEANGNYGKEMKPHVRDALLKIRRKLTDQQISEIQSLFSTGEFTQTSLAERFNVSLTQIHRIIKGKSWGDKKHDEILTKKNMTIEDARTLKELYYTGNYTQKELAKQFNCSVTHINKIINGKKWKNI